MSIINKKSEKLPKKATPHTNFMGGPSYTVNPLLTLKMAAASCFFGEPQYYRQDPEDDRPSKNTKGTGYSRNDGPRTISAPHLAYLTGVLGEGTPKEWVGKTPRGMMEMAIDQALDYDLEGTLRFAAELRKDLHIRTTPQVIMVRAAQHPKIKGTNLIGKYALDILARVDEVAVQMAYHMEIVGKPIPSSLKRAWAKRLKKADDYQLAKYKLTGHEVNMFDVVNICHAKSPSIDKLMKGQLTLTDKTWEAVRAAGGSWEDAYTKMPYMALLRNIRNLADTSVLNKALERLERDVLSGQQLPFRFLSAFNATKDLGNLKIQATLEKCLEKSIELLPRFPGKVMSLSDNSGSAHGALTSKMGTMSVASIGNLMGVLTAKCADEGHVGVFGDRLRTMKVEKSRSILTTTKAMDADGAAIGHGTENGIWLFWDKAIRSKEHWDYVFVYSDMQAGHGGLYGTNPSSYKDYLWRGAGRYIDVPKLIAEYRKKVNPDVLVFLVQTAGYTDTLIPEFYDKTYILGGWSESIIRFAAEMANITRTPKQ